ncbi:MAG: threonylcarbamoyl-AMP synthase [Chitinophagia bacterium]|jgi:L-threonylcarbamoyladenylate synthase|nr:threonylcarbamoyl-AMP synthase [Chitinophagia bacterium]NCA29363.1 threonylcarbamoyl-AMP synthase [Chitinophagia bacterium]NDD16821.1 threonylcarbamoyl-AMP synthase [Chitinophagia bacterium]
MFVYEEDIQLCLTTLQNGGLILYPTDTVWGIGCDATNEEAVAKIFTLKKRVDTKAMIILLGDESMLTNYVTDNNVQIFDYIKGIHKPTTVIYQNAKNLASNLLAADGSVAIRITKDTFCKDLIKLLGKPIVSTSANISGYPTPLCFADISLDIKEGVEYVAKYRQEETNMQMPSSIVKWDEAGNLIIIRS